MSAGWLIFQNGYDPCHPWSAQWRDTWDGYDVFTTPEAAANYVAKHPQGPAGKSAESPA